jgi:hypothetical protein
MAYLKVKTRVGVRADRAAAMAKDPGLLTRWLDGVVVSDLGDDRTHWEVDGGPVFDVLRLPTGDKRLIRWRVLSGPRNCGAIRFHPDGAATEVIVELAWDGGKARLLRHRLKDALRDFRYEAERLPASAGSDLT